MPGFSGATGVPLKQMQDAIAQSTANISAERQIVTMPANTDHINATLDVPSGYAFLSVVNVTSSGWIGFAYCSLPRIANSLFWVTSTSTSDRNIEVTYLVKKNMHD